MISGQGGVYLEILEMFLPKELLDLERIKSVELLFCVAVIVSEALSWTEIWRPH